MCVCVCIYVHPELFTVGMVVVLIIVVVGHPTTVTSTLFRGYGMVGAGC